MNWLRRNFFFVTPSRSYVRLAALLLDSSSCVNRSLLPSFSFFWIPKRKYQLSDFLAHVWTPMLRIRSKNRTNCVFGLLFDAKLILHLSFHASKNYDSIVSKSESILVRVRRPNGYYLFRPSHFVFHRLIRISSWLITTAETFTLYD